MEKTKEKKRERQVKMGETEKDKKLSENEKKSIFFFSEKYT